MLQVTDAAISVLKREILHQGEPLQEVESVEAIRLHRTVASDGQPALALQPMRGPQPTMHQRRVQTSMSWSPLSLPFHWTQQSWMRRRLQTPRSPDETCEAVRKEFGLASKPPKRRPSVPCDPRTPVTGSAQAPRARVPSV